jgi:DNA invertase Pin-like site-specific DNA recombinase
MRIRQRQRQKQKQAKEEGRDGKEEALRKRREKGCVLYVLVRCLLRSNPNLM